LELMRGMISAPDFSDQDRVRELLEQDWSHIETSLGRMANRMAHQLAAARVREASSIEVLSGGLQYVRWLQKTIEELEGSIGSYCSRLSQLSQDYLRGPAELVLTGEAPVLQRLSAKGFCGLLELPPSVLANAERPPLASGALPAYQVDGRVAFVAQAYETVGYTDPRSPLLAVASSLMENTSLHTDIRERGGAYGASASVHSLAGIWSFGSYRDPHIQATGRAFDQAINRIAAGEFNQQELLEAQLSTLQSIDALPAPGTRGMLAWRRLREGLTPQVRQEWKNGVLNATRESVMQAVQDVLVPQQGRWQPVVFAGAEVLDREGIGLREAVLNQPPGGSSGSDEEEMEEEGALSGLE
jgi:Zn-dependent M16 (insulinase) family peptidase